MLGVILWTLAALVGLTLLLAVCAALLPWHVVLEGRTDPAPDLRLRLRPGSARMPALIRLRLPSDRPAAAQPEDVPPEAARKAPRKARRRPRAGGARAARVIGRLLPVLPALLRDTIAGVHLDRLEAQGRFGLADPAETGMLRGQLCPLLWAPPWRGGRVSLTIMPDFDRPGFSGEGQLALHLVPLRLAWPALRFALTEGRRAWFAT